MVGPIPETGTGGRWSAPGACRSSTLRRHLGTARRHERAEAAAKAGAAGVAQSTECRVEPHRQRHAQSLGFRMCARVCSTNCRAQKSNFCRLSAAYDLLGESATDAMTANLDAIGEQIDRLRLLDQTAVLLDEAMRNRQARPVWLRNSSPWPARVATTNAYGHWGTGGHPTAADRRSARCDQSPP